MDSDAAAERRELRRAVVEAGHGNDPTIVDESLTSADPQLRALALSARSRQGRLTEHDLAKAAGDDDPSVRRRTAELAAAGHPTIARVLLDDTDPSVTEMAAWALGESPGDNTAIPGLIAVAGNHEDALCREAAVASLGALGDRAGLETILAALDDIATVRRRAVIALASFDGPDVDTALGRATDDRDWQVRQAAEDLVGDDRE
jgi:HEAT repeat protein